MRGGSFLTVALGVGLLSLVFHSAYSRPNLSVQRDLDWLVFAHAIGLFHAWACLVVVVFFLNVVTREVSWVDRLWSVLPPCSAWLIVLKKLPVRGILTDDHFFFFLAFLMAVYNKYKYLPHPPFPSPSAPLFQHFHI